ncbi:UNVERIFIED_CONTAM: hypothetical protein PYX00_004262 [Menopon gallinae]|uniref:Uncharacterized protein n=1 Tax=Menopon gallinae TaxID=328185 RepID=A0AAW2I2Z1_9NEOP
MWNYGVFWLICYINFRTQDGQFYIILYDTSHISKSTDMVSARKQGINFLSSNFQNLSLAVSLSIHQECRAQHRSCVYFALSQSIIRI